MGNFKGLNIRKALTLALLAYEGGDRELSKEQMNQYLPIIIGHGDTTQRKNFITSCPLAVFLKGLGEPRF